MATSPNLEMACAVLPEFPVDIEAYTQNGAAVTLRISGTEEDRLQAFTEWGAAREEMDLLIPIRHPERGGYDIACRVTAVYFEGGTLGRVELEISSVKRRKPYRAAARAAASALASVRVVAGRHPAARSEFDVRLVDVSSGGVAFQTERKLSRGDIISLAAKVPDTTVFITARVVNVDRSAYGRSRIGCELLEATEEQRRRLAEFVASRADTTAAGPAAPAEQRRAS
jgi:PilZ domain